VCGFFSARDQTISILPRCYSGQCPRTHSRINIMVREILIHATKRYLFLSGITYPL